MMITLHTTQNHLDKAGVYQGEYCSNTTSTLGQGVFLSFLSLPSFLTKEDAVQRSTSPRGRGGSLSHVCSSQYLLISETDFTFQKNSKTNYIFQKKTAERESMFLFYL